MPEDLGERSEEATPKRRQDARREGNVARSQDLGAAILLVTATLALAVAALWMLGEARTVIANVLSGSTVSDPLDPAETWVTVRYVIIAALRVAAPVLLIAWSAALLSQFMQVGWMFAPNQLQPKLSKLNPLNGFKRIFGLSGIFKASLDSVKVLIVAVIAALTIEQYGERIIVMPYMPVMACLGTAGAMMFDLALRILILLVLLGILDYAYQRWKHFHDMKMTKQQVKDEMKETEGDPEVRRRRMRIQQQIAAQRINAAVPKADVVVTNPEHISIALKYDQDTMNAPRVLAKGADHLALRIRQIALRHGIPVVERKPLARALYKQVAVGQEIPPDFYTAVAEVLAYVYRLNAKQAS